MTFHRAPGLVIPGRDKPCPSEVKVGAKTGGQGQWPLQRQARQEEKTGSGAETMKRRLLEGCGEARGSKKASVLDLGRKGGGGGGVCQVYVDR